MLKGCLKGGVYRDHECFGASRPWSDTTERCSVPYWHR